MASNYENRIWSRVWFLLIAISIINVSLIVLFASPIYVPTPEYLLNPVKNSSVAFVVAAKDIQGVYGNVDVASNVYHYKTDLSSEVEFWSQLNERAQADGWYLVDSHSEFRRYQRVRHPGARRKYHSVEEVRVAFRDMREEVVVAWVLCEGDYSVPRLPNGDLECGFAERHVWPRFSALLDDN